MATTQRHGKPYFWVTYLTGLLAGTSQCEWATWFKSKYKYDKRVDNFDLAAWSADHDQLVRAHAQKLLADGWNDLRTENQNTFHLHGQHAILAGQPDLIAKKNGTVRLVDGKTGEQSKKDYWQVLLYLIAIPMVWKAFPRMHGEVVYKTGSVFIEPEEVTPVRREEVFSLIRRLASTAVVPPRTPSASECRFCEIACCEDRWKEGDEQQVSTSEF